LLISNAPGTTQDYQEALAQEWKACGMNVTLDPVSTANENQLRADGQFQAFETANGGIFDPYPIVAPYSLPSSSTDTDSVNSSTITNLIDATGYTTNTTALKGIWTRIYAA
jgi:hypothetical protein